MSTTNVKILEVSPLQEPTSSRIEAISARLSFGGHSVRFPRCTAGDDSDEKGCRIAKERNYRGTRPAEATKISILEHAESSDQFDGNAIGSDDQSLKDRKRHHMIAH